VRLLRHEIEETELRAMFASSPDAITVSDLNGNITDCNRATLDMGGFSSKDEVIGKNALEFIAKKDRQRAMENLKRTLEQGSVKNIEYTFLTKDGREYPAELSASVIKDSSGNPTGFVAITKDITERKKAEEALQASEKNWSNSFNSLEDVMIIINKDYTIENINDKGLQLLGKTREEVIGKKCYQVILGVDAPSEFCPGKRMLKTGKVESADRYMELFGKHFNIKSSPIFNERGEIVGFVDLMRDITERKQMEEKLRQYSEHLEELVRKRTEELLESEKRYSVLVEEASDGVVILQDGKIVFTNKKGPKIVGYSRNELTGVPFGKLVEEKYRQLVKERYEQRLRGEKVPAIYEIELIGKTGERVPVEVSSDLIHYQGRPADLIIVRDIRERKRLEEERLKLEKLAAIGELATMVGHDLRNPLQSIENATYYLNNELLRLPTTQKTLEMLQIINNSVNYADKIIRDLQDFSATKNPILKKTNINTIVKETLSQVKAPENMELIIELGHLPRIEADKDQIKRAFLNLAINGIQAMQNGGRLKVSTKKTKDFVEISFKDTGVGMSKENMEKIFTPFFTTRAIGMGMGLPICKKFIDAHNGSIEVESEVGKGSTFTVKLPIQ